MMDFNGERDGESEILLQIRNHHLLSEESIQPQLRKLTVFFLGNKKWENENVGNITSTKLLQLGF